MSGYYICTIQLKLRIITPFLFHAAIRKLSPLVSHRLSLTVKFKTKCASAQTPKLWWTSPSGAGPRCAHWEL